MHTTDNNTAAMTAQDWRHKGYDFHYEGAYEQAVACWQKAADMGDLLGKYHLAEAYRMGEGVAQDYVKAAALYEDVVACTELSDPEAPAFQCDAAFMLGLFHEDKLIPNASMEKALEYYNFAVANGNPHHLYKLAKLYLSADGISKEYVEVAGPLYAGFPWRFPAEAVRNILHSLQKANEKEVPGFDDVDLAF